MDNVRRCFRLDSFIAENLTEYAKYCICSESNIVEVALAQLFARGSAYIDDSLEEYNMAGNAREFVESTIYKVVL